VLRLYDADGVTQRTLDNIEEFYVEHVSGGFDTLSFDIAQEHPLFKFIYEEILIEYDELFYTVRNINKRSKKATISCDIWDDEWKTGFFEAYSPGSQTCVECLEDILPGGWSITDNAYITTKYAYDLTYITSYSLFLKIQDTFGVAYEIDNKNKILRLINPNNNVDRGAYFTDELNLTELTYKNSSTDLVTRLYAFGKENLSFDSINGGNKYVDNHTYTDKVVTGYWKDERYTVVEDLLAAAKKKLNDIAYPTRSYSCSVTDIASVDNKYTFLHVALYDMVTLLDRNSATRRTHVVATYRVYPLEPNKNIVTLSSDAKEVKKSIKTISSAIEGANESGGFVYEAVKNATALITGQKGGYVVLDPPEKPSRILIMNTPDKNTATKCWQFNLAGLGYSANGIDGNYGIAMTMDGAIVANYITAGEMAAYRIKTGKLISTNYAANQSGTCIDMDNGSLDSKNFKFDSAGNATIANATFTGGIIQSSNYITNTSGTKINLSDGSVDSKNLKVDSSGNVSAANATLTGVNASGTISGSTINGSTVNGTTINGGNLHITDVANPDDQTRIYIKSTNFSTNISPGGSRSEGPVYYGYVASTEVGVRSRDDTYHTYFNTAGMLTSGNVLVGGNLQVYGTKNRIVKTQDYGEVLHYAYETSSPYFGDIGEAEIGEDGKTYISFSPIFLQTIDENHKYQVFVQKYSEGNIEKIERNKGYFIVYGTAGLEFSWEIKAKQKEYSMERLENHNKDVRIEKKDITDKIENQKFDEEIVCTNYSEKIPKQKITVESELNYGDIARAYFNSLKNIYEEKEIV